MNSNQKGVNSTDYLCVDLDISGGRVQDGNSGWHGPAGLHTRFVIYAPPLQTTS